MRNPTRLVMRRGALVPISLLMGVFPSVRADVTLRYSSDVQLAAFLPTEMVKSMQGTSGTSQTIRMKGNKGYTTSGKFLCIVDFVKQELTMVDEENKRVATVPVGQYSEKILSIMPKMPEEARKSLESTKVNFDSRKTGRTDIIQGVEAEEREVTLSMEMRLPVQEQVVPTMKMVMQIWTAKPEEALRVQAIRELTAYNLWTGYFMNPASSLGKMFGSMPGLGNGLSSMFDEMAKNKAVMLRTNMSLYSTFFAQLAQNMQKQGKPLPESYDPDAPVIQIRQEAAELSTAPLEDSIFQVSDGYQTVPMEDLMRAMIQPKE